MPERAGNPVRKPLTTRPGYWVRGSAGRGPGGAITNCVACNTPSPLGVGIATRNGTMILVPASGTTATSMSRCSIRYLRH